MPATPTIRRVTSVRGTRGFIALPQVDPGQRVWCKSSPHARTLLWERSALLEVRRSGAIRIDCLRSPDSILDDLTSPALALYHMGRGCGVLHAGGLARGGVCAALLGPPGAGKSSLVLAGARRGMEVVSDEIVPFRRQGSRFVVPGGSPVIRIDPAALGRATRGSAPDGARNRVRRKTAIDVRRRGWRFTGGPWRLAALIFLGDRTRRGGPAARIEPLAPMETVVGLIDQTYNRKIMTAGEWRAHLRTCAAVAERIPAHRLVVRQGLKSLPRAVTLVKTLLDRARR